MEPSKSERLHSIDALRAAAMLLGIYMHTVNSFCMEFWAGIEDVSKTPLAAGILNGTFFFFHLFRMHAFFMVAGFFARFLYHRDGPAGMLANRAKRILLPFLAGMALLVPAVFVLREYNMAGAPRAGILETIASQVASWEFWSRMRPHYLWFLLYLVIFYLVSAAVRSAISVIDPKGGLGSKADRVMARICRGGWAPVFLAVPSLAPALAIRNPMMAEVGMSFVPEIGLLAMYGMFFLFGWLLHRQASLLGEIAARWPRYLAIGLTCMAAGGIAVYVMGPPGPGPGGPPPMERNRPATDGGVGGDTGAPSMRNLDRTETARFAGPPRNGVTPGDGLVPGGPGGPGGPPPGMGGPNPLEMPWPMLAAALVQRGATMLLSWSFSLAMVGLFVRYFRRPSPLFRYIADSSYWLYLAHIPVLMAIHKQMESWAIPWPIKIVLLNLVLFAVLLLGYHCLVRSTWIGAILNGRRYPRRFPWPGRDGTGQTAAARAGN